MNTPHEYLPVGSNTYDALDGAFASIGRTANKEHAIEMALRDAFEAGADPDHEVNNLDQFLHDRALALIARLDEIDRS